MLHAKYSFIVLLDFDNFINSLFCNYFNYFDLVMRASSLLAFRCYFELPSINKDFTSLHFTSKRDDCTSCTVLNRVKEQEKAIALLSKEIHLGVKSAFLHCLAMSFSAKNSTKNITSWDGSLCSNDLVDTAKRGKAASTSKASKLSVTVIVKSGLW